MLRSPWFWLTLLLIAVGLAVTAALGVFSWLALTLAIGILIVDGILLYNAYVIKRVEVPDLPRLEYVPDQNRIPLIHDCDLTMGRALRNVGDGLALLQLLGEPLIDLQAVTTTHGNGPVGMTTRAAQDLLARLDLGRMDVIRGANKPDQDPGENKAARYLVDMVNTRPGQVVLLATGPLTNLKHAVALDPDFFGKLRSLHLVGGSTGSLTWNGRRLEERNFSADPEAAYRAVQARCPTTITLGEAGLTAVFRSPHFAALRALEDPVCRLIVRQTRLWFGLMRLWFQDDGFAMWESIAAMAITHPEYVQFQRVHLPITVDDLRCGRLVTDPSRAGPVRLVHGVKDSEGFIRRQLAAWHHLGQSIERKTERSR